MYRISVLNNIYYEIRWFCKEILDSKNRKRCRSMF